MPRRIRNMGTATMRFNEGIVVSGSIDTSYASQDGVAIVCTGSLEIAANSTNSQVVRIISNDSQREMVFDSLGTSGGGSAVAAQLIGNDSGGLRIDASNLPSVGSFFKINTGTEFTFLFNASGNTQRPNDATQININASTDAAVVVDRIVAAINGDPSFSQSSVYYKNDIVSNRPTNITATENGSFTNGITLTANATGTGGNSFFLFTNTSKFSVIQNSNQLFTGGSASSGGSTTQETIASIFTETDDDLVISGSEEVHIRSGQGKAVMILSGTIGGATSPNPSNFTDTNLFVSGTIDSMGTAVKGTSVFGGDLHVSGAAQINTVTVTSAGKVGIGTTTPSYKLEVGGNMSVGEYIYHRNDDNTFIRYQTDVLSMSAGGVEFVTLEENSSQPSNFFVNKDFADMDFSVMGQGLQNMDLFYVDASDGNVGIGTQPDEFYKLHVSGGLATYVLIGEGGDGQKSTQQAALFFSADKGDESVTGSFGVESIQGGAGGVSIGSESAHDVDLRTGGQMVMFLSASRDVGIGTSSPEGRLHITDTGVTTQLIVGNFTSNDHEGRINIRAGSQGNDVQSFLSSVDTALGGDPRGIVGTSTNHPFAIRTNNTSRVHIKNSGEVGIGLTSPQAELHIEASNDDPDIVLSRNDSDIQNSEALGTVHFAGTENGSSWGYGARISGVAAGNWSVGADIPTRLEFYTTADAASTATRRMTIDKNGRVGIGTNVPQAEFHIYSSNDDADIILSRNDTDIANNDILGSIHFAGTEDGSNFGYGARISAVASDSWTAGSDIPTRLEFYTANDGAGSVTQKMVIADDGNVGIGTSFTSDAKLTVTGSVLINGFSQNTSPRLRFQNDNINLTSNAVLGELTFSNFGDASVNEAAIIRVNTDGPYNPYTKSRMTFLTADGNGQPPTEVMRLEDQSVMIGTPASSDVSGYNLGISGSMIVRAVSNGLKSGTIVTDRIKLREIYGHPDQTASQLMLKFDDTTGSPALRFNPNAGTIDLKVMSNGNDLALHSDSSVTHGQILIGCDGQDGGPEYSNYLVNDASGLYVEGEQSTKAVATIVNRSTATTSDGLAIIIGKGQYFDSGAHHDFVGNNNEFIVFYDKDRGNSHAGLPDDVQQVGFIAGDGTGGITVQDSFTGTHDTVTEHLNNPGLIIESTGDMWIDASISNATCALPKSRLCSTAKSKSVFGVVRYNELRNGRAKRIPQGWTGVVANAIGEGKVWVTNIGGNIENGDYITSSNIAGYGMLQDDDLLHNYTVAKCTQTVDWNSVTDTIEYEGTTYKKYLIACTYHCG